MQREYIVVVKHIFRKLLGKVAERRAQRAAEKDESETVQSDTNQTKAHDQWILCMNAVEHEKIIWNINPPLGNEKRSMQNCIVPTCFEAYVLKKKATRDIPNR